MRWIVRLFDRTRLPEEFQEDLNKAISTLKNAGTTAIYLFGSLAEGRATHDSDIDLAIQGIAPQSFFDLYSRTARGLKHELDLIDLDHEKVFARFLRETNRLVQIA